jgi:hypothetical protein
MVRLLRRIVLVSLVVGSIAFVVRRRRGTLPAGSSSGSSDAAWPPIAREPRPFVETKPKDGAPAWVEPVDGQCPDGYPIKANDTSGIFHVPGGRFYDRTVPERCYAEAEAATADGYRAAKA